MQIRKFDDGFDLGATDFVNKTPLNKDVMYMMPAGELAERAQLVLSYIQGERPEVILGATSLLFAALCIRCKVDPEDMFNFGKRVYNSPPEFDKTAQVHLEVLRDFIGGRLMGEEVTVG